MQYGLRIPPEKHTIKIGGNWKGGNLIVILEVIIIEVVGCSEIIKSKIMLQTLDMN